MRLDTIINRDALCALRELPAESVHCCVTSPPYYALRDYGMDAQIGREDTPEQYITRLVEVFRELKRVLRPDGTFWLNIADTYCGTGSKGSYTDPKNPKGKHNGYRKEIFFLFLLHYNDTCKVNSSFTGGECKVVKLNILNMKNFLDTVNSCSGKVNMLCPDGKKQNINGEEKIQGSLWRQYSQNKNCLRLVLEVPNPTDYMNIVSYYAGDC